jgi:3-oxoacyl-[acyl-carrier-protein] synthase III
MFRFVYAVLLLISILKGMYKNILVMVLSTFNWIGYDNSWSWSFSYFGDGAGAAVLSREEDKEYCLRIYTQKGNMPKS